MGLVRMVRPWDEWLIVWGYDIKDPPPEVDEEVATRVVHNLVGDDTIEVTLRTHLAVGQQQDVRHALRRGARVLHGRRLPPAPAEQRAGLEHVDRRRVQPGVEARAGARGQGGAVAAGLLRRRARADRQADRAAREPEHRGVRADLRGARAIDMEVRKENSPRGAESRAKLKAAIELKNYEFNAHGVELGHRYRSGAVVAGRHAGAGVHARPGALLPPDDVAGRAAAARVARAQAARRSPRTTSPARAASRSSPASAARAGWRPRRT